jgi:hypothetical protein
MNLSFLDFDASLAADGAGNFDAMATVSPGQRQALLEEVAAVLSWADAQFPGAHAALDDGGEWDYYLQCQQEWTADEGMAYDLATQQFSMQAGPPGMPRHNLTLSLSGSAQFCAAFAARFLQAKHQD